MWGEVSNVATWTLPPSNCESCASEIATRAVAFPLREVTGKGFLVSVDVPTKEELESPAGSGAKCGFRDLLLQYLEFPI